MGVGSSSDTQARVDRTRSEGVTAVERIEAYFLDPGFCERLAMVETDSLSQLEKLEDDELKRVGIRLGFKSGDTGTRAGICEKIRRHWCARRRLVFQALKVLEDFDRRMEDVLKGSYCFDEGGLLPRPVDAEFESVSPLQDELEDPQGCMPNAAWAALTAAEQAYKDNRVRRESCSANWKEPTDDTWVRSARDNRVYAAAVTSLQTRFARAAKDLQDVVTELCVMQPLTPAMMTTKVDKLKGVKAELDQCLEAFVQEVGGVTPLNAIDIDRIAKERERQERFTREALKAQKAAAKQLFQMDKQYLQSQAKLVRSSAIGPPPA